MAHGAPDDSNVVKRADLFRVDDDAELAARLGSILTYRRSGEVISLEDWSGGYGAWERVTSGTNSSIVLSGDKFQSGGVSLRGRAGPTTSNYWRISRYLPRLDSTVLGFQGALCLTTEPGDIDILLRVDAVTTYTTYLLRYDRSAMRWYYQDATQTWVTFTDSMDLDYRGTVFLQWQVVVDMEKEEYVRLSLNHETWSLVGIPARVAPYVTYNSIQARVQMYGTGSGYVEAYLDNVVLTQNEV